VGALSFSAFKELLKFRGGNNPALDAAGASGYNYYGIWINSAYRQLCTQDNILGLPKKIHFPQLLTSTTKTTVDGTATIDVPTDNLFITEVFDTTNGRKLHQISWKKYIEYTDRTDTAAEGDPTEWTHRGSYVYLHPTPSTTGDTITEYYKKLVTDLSGTQETDIGAEWDDVIIELAFYKLAVWTHDFDKAKYAREAFLEMAGGLADIYTKGELDSDLTLGPSPAYMPGH
jgi:hypothetical protein